MFAKLFREEPEVLAVLAIIAIAAFAKPPQAPHLLLDLETGLRPFEHQLPRIEHQLPRIQFLHFR